MTIKEAVEKFDLPESRIRSRLLDKPAWAAQETEGRKVWVIDEALLTAAIEPQTKFIQEKLSVRVERHGALKVKVIGTEQFIAKSSVDEYLMLAKAQRQ